MNLVQVLLVLWLCHELPDAIPQGAVNDEVGTGDHDAAWTEMTKVCSDLVGSIVRHLAQGSEWQMELLDETKKPAFKISLRAETLG